MVYQTPVGPRVYHKAFYHKTGLTALHFESLVDDIVQVPILRNGTNEAIFLRCMDRGLVQSLQK